MKKAISIILSVLLGCSILGGCANPGSQNNPDDPSYVAPVPSPSGNGTGVKTDVKVVPATEKLKQEDEPQSYTESVNISCAKNEYESAQLIVKAKEKIDDLCVVVSDLKSGENTISTNNITVYWEHYIFFAQKDIQNPTITGLTEGYYPDALVPLNLRRNAKETQVEKGKNQGIWITVKTSENTVAGNYSGKITLFADGKEEKTQVDFNLEVYDFTLPKANHGQTAFAIWDLGAPTTDLLHLGYGDDADLEKISENYYEFLLDYRLSATWIPNMTILSFDERMESYLSKLEREEVASLALPYSVSGQEVNFDNFERVLTKLADFVLEKQKPELIDKTYAYFTVIDEPQNEESYARVKRTSKGFQDTVKKVAAQKFAESGKEVYREKFEDLRCLVTTQYNDAMVSAGIVNGEGSNENDGSGIDTWCPTFNWFDTEQYRTIMENRKEQGDHVWFYGCVMPKAPYANLHVPDFLLPQRVTPWMQFEYGIEGQLYWCVNNYGVYKGSYVERDVWTDGMSWVDAGGDGQITYPGAKYGLDSPIPTIRLDNLRAGQEDYEYLYLLKTLYEEAGKPCGVEFNEYISNLYKQLYQGAVSRNDSAIYESVRKELAALIVLAKQGVFAYTSVDRNNVCTAVVSSSRAPSSVKVNGEAIGQKGALYESKYTVTTDTLNAEFTVEFSDKTYTLTRFTGGAFEHIEDFENDAILPRVSIINRGLTVNKSLGQGKEGKALKIDCGGAESNGTFNVTINGSYDLTDAEKLIADLYNDSDTARTVKILFRDANKKTAVAYEAYLQPKAWNHVDTLLNNVDLRKVDFGNIQDVYFTISVKEGESPFALLFDNLAFTKRGNVVSDEPIIEDPNVVSRWSFGTTQGFTFAQWAADSGIDGMKIVNNTDCSNGKALQVTIGANGGVSFLPNDNQAKGAKFVKFRIYAERAGNYTLNVQEKNGAWAQLLGDDNGIAFTLKRGWNEYQFEFNRTIDCEFNNFVFKSKDNVASKFLIDTVLFTKTATNLEKSPIADDPASNTVAGWSFGETDGFELGAWKAGVNDTMEIVTNASAQGGKALKVTVGAGESGGISFAPNDNTAFCAGKVKLRIYSAKAANITLNVQEMGGDWVQLLGSDGASIALQTGWNEYELTFSKAVNYKFNNFVFKALAATDTVEFYIDTVIFTVT